MAKKLSKTELEAIAKYMVKRTFNDHNVDQAINDFLNHEVHNLLVSGYTDKQINVIIDRFWEII